MNTTTKHQYIKVKGKVVTGVVIKYQNDMIKFRSDEGKVYTTHVSNLYFE